MTPTFDDSSAKPLPDDPTKIDIEGESNDRAVRVPEGTDPATGKPLPKPPATPPPGAPPHDAPAGAPHPTPHGHGHK